MLPFPTLLTCHSTSLMTSHLTILTGETTVSYHMSKTKAVAVHAGLSQLLAPSSLQEQLLAGDCTPSPNNSLSTALGATATWAAVAVGTTGPGPTCKETHYSSTGTTPTSPARLETQATATTIAALVTLTLLVKSVLQVTLTQSCPRLTAVQSQSLSRPTLQCSRHTPQE